MAGHLGTLARDARPAEGLNVRGHAAPEETAAHITERRVAASMRHAVDVGEQALGERSGDDGTGRGG